MTRVSSRRRLAAWTLPPLAAFAGFGLAAEHAPTLALINESPSLPRGLYVRTVDQTPAPGAVVAVEPPPTARRYLSDLGMPGEVPLLKRVVASGGQRVCRDGSVVTTPLRTDVAPTRDRRGATLPTWRGCMVLAGDQLFLLGDTPGSFDSRYFGPVRRSEIRGVYREILTW